MCVWGGGRTVEVNVILIVQAYFKTSLASTCDMHRGCFLAFTDSRVTAALAIASHLEATSMTTQDAQHLVLYQSSAIRQYEV